MPTRYRAVGVRAREFRRTQTPAEERLWTLLRDRRNVEWKFRRQHPIGTYVADFYCHEVKLIVELDGGVHEETAQIAHDVNREANLTSLGYTILRFTNEEVFQSSKSVLGQIAGTAFSLAVTLPPFPKED